MNKQTKIIIAVALLAALVGFYLYSKKATANAESAAVGPPVNAQDEANFQAQVSKFKELCDPKALSWMLPLMKQYLEGTATLTAENQVNGKATKAGAFAQVYGQTYWPPQYGYKQDPKAGEILYQLFHSYKNQTELGAA